MSLKQNKDKIVEEKKRETKWAEEQLGIELEPLFDDEEEEEEASPSNPSDSNEEKSPQS